LDLPFSAAAGTTVPESVLISSARAVQQVAAVATPTSAAFGDEGGRYGGNRLCGTQQLDPPRRRCLLLGRQHGQDRDPIDLDFGLYAQDISDLGTTREDGGVDDTFGLSRSGGTPCVGAIAADAGQFNVEAVGHAPVKLQAGAGQTETEAA
jgi:hypothetical protein